MLTYNALQTVLASLPQGGVATELTLFSLHNYGVIQVSGPDTEKFLQGQLTCDCKGLALQQVLLGAHCTSKGRMISSFWAAQSPEGVWLQVHASLLEPAYAALKKYSVFSKVQLSCPNGLSGIALEGQGAHAQLSHSVPNVPATGHCVWHQGVLWCVIAPDLVFGWGETPLLVAAISVLAQSVRLQLSADWNTYLVAKGWAEVRAETSEHFIPQELNFHQREGVSFKKGCYTGQEIVARMQYLGKQKKHLYGGCVSLPEGEVALGAPLYVADKQDAQGEVVAVSGQGQDIHFLAVVNDAAVEAGSVYFKQAAAAKISWLALPYAIP